MVTTSVTYSTTKFSELSNIAKRIPEKRGKL